MIQLKKHITVIPEREPTASAENYLREAQEALLAATLSPDADFANVYQARADVREALDLSITLAPSFAWEVRLNGVAIWLEEEARDAREFIALALEYNTQLRAADFEVVKVPSKAFARPQ